MFKQTLAAFIAVLGLNTAAAAQTAGALIGVPTCAPPKLVNSLPMEQVPGSNLMTVTAIIDGSPEKMLFDIGRMSSQVWNTTAAKFHLAVQQGGRGWDFAGRYSEDSARVADFAIGSMQTGGFHIRVSPDPDAVPAPFAGIIRNDMMWRYDIDLDFAHQRLNYFSPEQCKGAGIYWSPTTITSVPIVAYTGLEYDDRSPIPRLGTTYVPVTLDGHTIIALLDTSADRTFLNSDVAKRLFGLSPDSAETGDVTDGGTRIKAGLHRFSSLSFGGLTASNPQIAIPFDIKTQSSGISHISKTARDTFYLHEIIPDLVIGMDVLKHAHLYVAFESARVYVSAAGEGPALKPEPITQSWFNVYGRPQY
jgi:Aspartyl protease